MMIHSVIHVTKERESGERWTSLSSKILIFFKKKTKRKKNCFLSSLSCVPTFFKKAPSSSFIIDPIAEREREKERERKAAQNRRLFVSSFFLKESFNNT